MDPAATVRQLVETINRGDVDGAVRLYESDAVLVAQPQQIARGTGQIREALAGFITLKASLRSEAERVVEAGDLALYVGRWNLRGIDPSGKPVEMAGESTDVLRRSRDGQWLIAVDNPWGVAILPSR